VATVTRLVETLKDKPPYDRVRIETGMLHGSRSYVEFNFRDKPTTKELGDMAIITVVADRNVRLVQRLCIIQNKSARGDRWDVDEEQLFLLKNFPPLAGNRGIFKGVGSITFRNRSGCLGAYGLLHEPGEMVFASAGVVSECMRAGSSLHMRDTGFFPARPFPAGIINPWIEYPWSSFGPLERFLGNVHFCRDVYDFVKDWTQINIGEPTCWDNAAVNSEADGLANHLIWQAGLGHGLELPQGEIPVDWKFDGSMAVLVMRLDVGSKG